MTFQEFRTQLLLDGWVTVNTANLFKWKRNGDIIFLSHSGVLGIIPIADIKHENYWTIHVTSKTDYMEAYKQVLAMEKWYE